MLPNKNTILRCGRLASYHASRTTKINTKTLALCSSSFTNANRDRGRRKRTGKTALVVGCNGALGTEVVSYLHRHRIVDNIIGADIVPPQREDMMNDNFDQKHMLSHFIHLHNTFHGDDSDDVDMNANSLSGLTYMLESGMEAYEDELAEAASEHEAFEAEDETEEVEPGERYSKVVPLDAIICTAGGWIPTRDYSSSDEYILGVEQMLSQNLYPVIASSHIAAIRLKRRGLFVVFGAAAALAPAPGMLAYGISKAAVHYVVRTLGSGKQELVKDATRQSSPTVVGILPQTLDTPNNRKFAPPDTDFSQWTKLESIAEEVAHWIRSPDLRPHSGSLVKVHPDKSGDGDVFRLSR